MRTLKIIVAAALTFAVGTAHADDADYRFGPQDRVRIKVVEWRAGEAEYHEWQALTGDYAVGAGGSLSLPLIGMVKASGVTAHELANAIAESLQSRASLPVRPDVSVEVAQFRPVYVAGDVDRPGAYDFRPGLNVLQAVSLAGGIYRLREAGLIRLERDAITARGLFEQKRQELMRLLARRARLKIEKQGGGKVVAIDELVGIPDAERLIADEVRIMASRAENLEQQLDALADLKALLQKEIVSLGAKVKTMETQLASGRRDLDGIQGLVNKGLSTNSRQFTLEWQIADIEGKKIDFETAILRARQDISKAERDMALLKTNSVADIDAQTQATDAAIDQTRSAIDTQRGLIAEASVSTPQMIGNRDAAQAAEPGFTLVRQVDGASVARPADEFETLKPGDVLRVKMRQDGQPAPGANPPGSSRTSEVVGGRSAF